jgi:hypothetical protein
MIDEFIQTRGRAALKAAPRRALRLFDRYFGSFRYAEFGASVVGAWTVVLASALKMDVAPHAARVLAWAAAVIAALAFIRSPKTSWNGGGGAANAD